MRGHRTNQSCNNLLKDLHVVRGSETSLYLHKRNQVRLIEPIAKPEDFLYLGEKQNASIFAMSSSTKKRPFRLYLGRLYNHRLLDLLEFDVTSYSPLKGTTTTLPAIGSKPLVIFQGTAWDTESNLIQSKSILADMFGGIKAEKIALEGFDHVFICTSFDQDGCTNIKVDHFHIKLTKVPDSTLPGVQLTDIGPSFALRVGQSVLPAKDLWKAATKIPNETWERKKKNYSTNDLLETKKKVVVDKPDFTKLNTRHGHR